MRIQNHKLHWKLKSIIDYNAHVFKQKAAWRLMISLKRIFLSNDSHGHPEKFSKSKQCVTLAFILSSHFHKTGITIARKFATSNKLSVTYQLQYATSNWSVLHQKTYKLQRIGALECKAANRYVACTSLPKIQTILLKCNSHAHILHASLKDCQRSLIWILTSMQWKW